MCLLPRPLCGCQLDQVPILINPYLILLYFFYFCIFVFSYLLFLYFYPCDFELGQVPILCLIYPPPDHHHHYCHHHNDHHLCLIITIVIIITTTILFFIDLSRAISSSAHVFHYSANQFLGHTTSHGITPFFSMTH